MSDEKKPGDVKAVNVLEGVEKRSARSAGTGVGVNVLERVPEKLPEAHRRPDQKAYQAVLKADCPAGVVSFGVVTFHRSTFRWSDETADATQLHAEGQIVALSDDELEFVKASLQASVCRPFYVRDEQGRRVLADKNDLSVTDDDGARWAVNGATQVVHSEIVRKDDGKYDLRAIKDYQRREGDHPWTRYVVLKHLPEEDLRALQEMGFVRRPKDDARTLNANEAAEEASGRSRARKPLVGFGREG